ncbi:hypothetical protein BJ741DRAFT_75519 [Chytriomyces cf. hyalinus JEL632]|nr:hypothetical protein BJ741DRAFT_75519 [Chytriomyces cf. hyalinus JEL632]
MFVSSAPTEQYLDKFALSGSLLLIANIQCSAPLPLAFEIRDEDQSWILCAQAKSSKGVWMDMLYLAISRNANHAPGESDRGVALDGPTAGGSSVLPLHPTGPPLSQDTAPPPYSPFERVNGSFINASFGVSSNNEELMDSARAQSMIRGDSGRATQAGGSTASVSTRSRSKGPSKTEKNIVCLDLALLK